MKLSRALLFIHELLTNLGNAHLAREWMHTNYNSTSGIGKCHQMYQILPLHLPYRYVNVVNVVNVIMPFASTMMIHDVPGYVSVYINRYKKYREKKEDTHTYVDNCGGLDGWRGEWHYGTNGMNGTNGTTPTELLKGEVMEQRAYVLGNVKVITEKAIKVEVIEYETESSSIEKVGPEVWLPRSQILPKKVELGEMELEVPEWLMKDKGMWKER